MEPESEFIISVAPYGMRVHSERLLLSRHLPTVAELGMAHSMQVFEATRDLGLRTRHQYESSPTDFADHFFPDEPTEIWISVADLLISVGNTFTMASHGLREAFGLLDDVSSQLEKASTRAAARRYLRVQSAAFLLEAVDQYFVSIGHQLAAASLRFGAACPAISAECTTTFFVDAMRSIRNDPTSDDPRAWPFLSKLGSKYKGLGAKSDGAAATCFGAIAGLSTERAFSALVEARNRAFHRVREDFLASNPELVGEIYQRLDLSLQSGRELAEACRKFVLGLHELSPLTIPFSDGTRIRMFQDERIQPWPRPGEPPVTTTAFSNLLTIDDCRSEHAVRPVPG